MKQGDPVLRVLIATTMLGGVGLWLGLRPAQWPLFIVAFGIGVVVRELLERRR